MPTNLMLMDAWRDKSNRTYETYKLAQSAPGLFKAEYVVDLTEELVNAEKWFTFWRGQE